MPRVDAWTHEEMILVLNLYLKLPFGKMDRRNPEDLELWGAYRNINTLFWGALELNP